MIGLLSGSDVDLLGGGEAFAILLYLAIKTLIASIFCCDDGGCA